MLNDHDPDRVDRFIALDHRNHNRFVGDGREANRLFWRGFSVQRLRDQLRAA